MVTGKIDLDELVRGMAQRGAVRTEATLQSDLHAFLLAAPLALEEQDLRDMEIVLEQQAGSRKRIDVEAGLCVFELKRDLRRGNVRRDAETQLAGYVVSRSQAMNQRYVGVLTDGAEWHLYHLKNETLHEVSTFSVDSNKPDVDGLCVWIESVLATSAKVQPTPKEIAQRLGATSPGHAIDFAELYHLYATHKNKPTVKLKRELWARLLTTAFGTGFTDEDELFVEHTLLVVTAEVIAHAVVGFDPSAQDVSPVSIVNGQIFASAQIYGVVEADFFDWIVEVPGGAAFVQVTARRLSRFAWNAVEHDVLKVLYESVISAPQRKKLGEYYTPDWLADRIVDKAIKRPLEDRVLDPSCGSGTFLFHAIRRYLKKAEEAGTDNAKALSTLTQKVIGMDIHPVAVTFARVTYLLAIGPNRLQAEDRPALSVPVYLGDSIQWGQERSLFTANALVIPTVGDQLWSTELRFPERTLDDAGRFDRLVAELAELASIRRTPGGPVPPLAVVFRRYAIHPGDQAVITETFKTMCGLHDAGANHIWGYYVRNLARPMWLTRKENRVDVVIGNPPWLAYRYMTATMQAEFRRLSTERGMWAGASVATNQDLSALFLVRCIERYLNDNGRFAVVMPWSMLRGRQFAGFRTGRFTLDHSKDLTVGFEPSWDLHGIKPTFFPVPCCVTFGKRSKKPVPMPAEVELWSGKLSRSNIGWSAAQKCISRAQATVLEAADSGSGAVSDYRARFAQGASIVPRMLFIVEREDGGPLGTGSGRTAVISRRSPDEKPPWKTLPALHGTVERQFARPIHVGMTILPYRALEPLVAVIPWDGTRLLSGSHEQLAAYPALSEWWLHAEDVWMKNRSKASTLSLLDQMNYRNKLTQQFPIPEHRIVYSKSGMYLAASVVSGNAIIDHKLYWATASSLEEAHYLAGILNSEVVTQRVRPLQARGEHNPRDFDKYVWQLPIPIFDPDDNQHKELSHLAAKAEEIAANVELPTGKRFEKLRKLVRETVAASTVGVQIEYVVAELLG